MSRMPKIFICHSSQDGIIDEVFLESDNFDAIKNDLAREFLAIKAKEDVGIALGNPYNGGTGIHGETRAAVDKYNAERHGDCLQRMERWTKFGHLAPASECHCIKFEPITPEIIAGSNVWHHATHIPRFVKFLEDKKVLTPVEFEALG